MWFDVVVMVQRESSSFLNGRYATVCWNCSVHTDTVRHDKIRRTQMDQKNRTGMHSTNTTLTPLTLSHAQPHTQTKTQTEQQ